MNYFSLDLGLNLQMGVRFFIIKKLGGGDKVNNEFYVGKQLVL